MIDVVRGREDARRRQQAARDAYEETLAANDAEHLVTEEPDDWWPLTRKEEEPE